MPLIGYSPWQDIGKFGQGLGDTLSQALIQLPRLRAEIQMQKDKAGRDAAEFPLQLALLQGQVDEQKSLSKLHEAQVGQVPILAKQKQDILKQREENTQRRMNQTDIGLGLKEDASEEKKYEFDAKKTAGEKKAATPKMMSPASQMELQRALQGIVDSSVKNQLPNPESDMAKVKVDPSIQQQIFNTMNQAATNGVPNGATLAGFQHLMDVLKVSPNISTHSVTNSPGGWFSKPDVSQVPVTNSFTAMLPPIMVDSQEAHSALPKGTRYVDSQGNVAVKQ
jgi:hypothetical protein